MRHAQRWLRSCVAAGVAAAGMATPLALTSPAHAATVRSSDLDAGSRQAVTAAYRSLWQPATAAPLQVSGGDPSSCTPYRTSAATQSLTRDAVNFARELVGLRPVTTVTNTHTPAAAASALLQAVNKTLTHSPDRGMACWTTAGAKAASQSNLDLRWTTQPGDMPTVGDVVSDYLVDRGSNNTEVGHRRWLLLPQTSTLGSGNAAFTDSQGTRYVTNNLWVVPDTWGNRPAGTPAFYGWPSAGWFPSPMEPEGRWSLSSSTGADFSHASVRVTHNGAPVRVTVQPYATGYGDNTLVWQMAQPQPATGSGADRYDITVTGIAGARSSSYSYSVRLFDPTWTDPSWPDGAASTRSTTTSGGTTSGTHVAAGRTSVALHGARRVHRTERARLRVVVYGAGTPAGRVVVRVDGHRVGRWALHDGHRTVRLPALHRGRHHVVVRYLSDGRWSPASARTTLRVVR